MIELTKGDLLQADAEALVNTVNCVGVMGKGIALQFKRTYPENYKTYRRICKRGELRTGMMLVHETGSMFNPRFIINFPTKQHWKGRSKLEYIDTGLIALVEEIESRKISSIAIPALGCSNGGLEWSEVRPRIEKALAAVPDVHVLLFEPQGEADVHKDHSSPRR